MNRMNETKTIGLAFSIPENASPARNADFEPGATAVTLSWRRVERHIERRHETLTPNDQKTRPHTVLSYRAMKLLSLSALGVILHQSQRARGHDRYPWPGVARRSVGSDPGIREELAPAA